MTLLQAIILGIIQGTTEFIPVSSSGHMILIPWLLGWDQPGLLFNVVAHLGTAAGVLAYFWQDWWTLLKQSVEWIRSPNSGKRPPRLLLLLVVAAIPVAVVGLALQSRIEQLFQEPLIPAVFLMATALLLFAGERVEAATKDEGSLTFTDSLIIGATQALALIPGISRSGATITAARFRKATRFSAARFSFLLATPIIIGAAGVEIVDAMRYDIAPASLGLLAAGFMAAFASGLSVIHWLLSYLKSRSTLIFAIYCACFSIFCITLITLRGG